MEFNPNQTNSCYALVARLLFSSLLVCGFLIRADWACGQEFVNWETAPIHPLALSPHKQTLALANLPAARLEIISVAPPKPVHLSSIPVGLDPVSIRYYSDTEVWVVCHISDAINVVNLETMFVDSVIPTLDGPSDVVFAGEPLRAFVSCSSVNKVMVIDPVSHEALDSIEIKGERPKALAVSPDGLRVYSAVFESGNASTILTPRFGLDFVPGSVVDIHEGPFGGMNPPPNDGNLFDPPIASNLIEPPPRTGLIVKKNAEGRWMDDNEGDWTEYVSGSKAPLSGRPIGWDMPDRDLAIINTTDHSIEYVAGLMNICMDVAVNPAAGTIAIVGTDGMNEVRFEPQLNGRFHSVELALIDPESFEFQRNNLNPHLNGKESTVPITQRELSVGDPRQVVWTQDGSCLFVSGMGSNNIVKLDANGTRLLQEPIRLEGGPLGMALHDERNVLYVYQRFDNKLSTLDLLENTITSELLLWDPTPETIRKGRPHFYDTHRTSGTGHTSCASCHLDGRFDRLAWDLGTPEGNMVPIDVDLSFAGRLQPDNAKPFHPMKGPMVTMTLQDIIGHEPLHWRGDRVGIEAFNPTFTDLQGREKELTHLEMAEFKAFLSTLHFPPNRYRTFSNALSETVSLVDHFSLGRDGNGKRLGESFRSGNARRGQAIFTGQGGCNECHTLSTGLGPHMFFNHRTWEPIPDGPLGEKHVALVQQPRVNNFPFKIASLRGLADKVGADFSGLESRVGFGFAHDGGVDSLTRFIQDGFNFVQDRSTSDLIAFLLSFTGSEISMGNPRLELNPPGLPSKDTHAAVGTQFLLRKTTPIPRAVNLALEMVGNPSDPVDVVGFQQQGLNFIYWLYDPQSKQFISDGREPAADLATLIQKQNEHDALILLVVPPQSGKRLALDWDLDGSFNHHEMLLGFNPYSAQSTPENLPPIIAHIPPIVVEPGSEFEIQIIVKDGNEPPDPIEMNLVGHVPNGAILSKTGVLKWTAPNEISDSPQWFEIEALDPLDPQLKDEIKFPVFHRLTQNEPHFLSMDLVGGMVHLEWRVEPGRVYQVFSALDIQHPVWFPLTAPWLADQVTLQAMDTRPSSIPKFYRIESLVE